MRYLILIISLTGGFLSFNSYSASCPVGATVPSGTYKPYYEIKKPDGTSEKYINVGGCEYWAKGGSASTPDGWLGSIGPLVSTGKPAKEGVSPSVDENGKNPAPELDDKPDVTPPVIDVKPPKPDTGTTGTTGSSGFFAELSSINSSSADSLYLSYHFDYNFNFTLEQNEQLAKAFLSKLSNVTPPSYYAVDHIRSMMDDWQKTYSYMRPSDAGPYYLWNATKFVGGEHRYRGEIVLPVNTCEYSVTNGAIGDDGLPVYHTEVSHNCSDRFIPLDIHDPDYASLNDYKNGITRCMRNPNDPSCHSSGGSGDSSPAPVIPDVSGGSSGSSSCPAGSFNVPGQGCIEVQCRPGFHPVAGATSSDYPTCVKDDSDTDTPNPGVGGGSGSGSTDNNDNGDVVAAINAFHADNNKNHKELMDDLNKKPAPPDYTGMEGDFSSMVGGAMSGITDSVKSAWDAGKTAFGEGLSGIDSMLPNIKTSFDLPPGFEAASLGRCIPVVLDFDIKLVGIPDYHFHAVGTQVCLLYDKYIRPVLNFVMVMLSFFVIHRLLIRSAEFLTDGRN